MTSEQSKTIYTFLGFQFSPNEFSLLHHNQPVKLNKKNHEVLLVLIQSDNQVVAKDDLIAAVWPNQIVTDAALNKQITRLRQVLSPDQPQAIIETVRGVGFKFIPEVNQTNAARQKRHYSWRSMTLVMLLLALLFVYAWWFKPNSPEIDFNELQITNLAVVPAVSNNDWLNVGGLNHLSTQLRAYQDIQTIKPEQRWFEQNDNDVLGIKVSQMPGIEYVLMVENENENNQYLAKLLLRNKDRILAKQTLKAATVAVLFNQIEIWTLQQLDISKEVIKNQQQKQPTTNNHRFCDGKLPQGSGCWQVTSL